MNQFLTLLQTFLSNQTEFSIMLGGHLLAVKVHSINGDHITLYATQNNSRYDLHFSQVVFASLQS